MEWVELVLPAAPLADEVAALLTLDGVTAAGVEVRGDDVVLWVPEEDAHAGLLALRAAAARLAAEGFPVDPGAARAQPAAREAEWRDAWKRYFHVERVTPRIVIVPSWESYTPAFGDVVLELDPGRAFGTGAHASTRLILHELDALAAAGRTVRRFLDVGTGSGILAIAAAKLWPDARGRAVDVDPIAVEAARENAGTNDVADRLVVGDDCGDGAYDVIVANIQADVLEEVRDELFAHLAPGGALVLSGLLTPQVEPVAAHYRQAGLELLRTRTLEQDPDWTSVVLTRAG